MHFLHSQRPCPGERQADKIYHRVYNQLDNSKSDYHFFSTILTSTELVVGAVTVEVVTLAVLATVDLGRILPLLAFTSATDTVTIVAADVCAVVLPAVCIQILCAHFIFAALAKTPNSPVITPATGNRKSTFSIIIHV